MNQENYSASALHEGISTSANDALDIVWQCVPFLRQMERDSRSHLELEIARNVQEAFLPEPCPSIPGLSCQAFYKPARTVGGDYYDFLPLQNGRWGFAIGDVSGKGIGAALMMASLQASLRAQALHSGSGVATVMDSVNCLLHGVSLEAFYASLFYMEYQPETRMLKYVNAGHCPPIVLRRNNGRCEVHELNAAGPPVGMLPHSRYAPASFQLRASDYVVAYTDGITEAQKTEDELWGQNRLESLLCSCRRQTPQQIVRRIVDEVSAFAVAGSQSDDMTLVVMQVLEQ